MSPNGGRWIDRLIAWCWGILGGAIALYCAVKLIEAIWPALIVIAGALAIIALIIRIVVYYTSKNSW